MKRRMKYRKSRRNGFSYHADGNVEQLALPYQELVRELGYAAFRAPRGQMQGGATKAMSAYLSWSANTADAHAPPESIGRMGVARGTSQFSDKLL
jgi:hypothetical protein